MMRRSLEGDVLSGVAPRIFRRGANSSDERAKTWLTGYHKWEKSPEKIVFHLPTGATAIYLWVLSRVACVTKIMKHVSIFKKDVSQYEKYQRMSLALYPSQFSFTR